MTTLTIPKALEKRLKKVSAESGRNPDVLARKAISERLDYLEGRLTAINAGFEDLQKGNIALTREVLNALDRIIARHGGRRRKAG
jgi:predicted transcriptional regulator